MRGRVINENGRPLRNARVLVKRLGSMQVELPATTTDGEGRFEMTGLQPVRYRVLAFLQGYTQLLRDPEDTQGPVHRPGDSVTLVLTKGGVITGTVTNHAGEPVVGVNVHAVMVNVIGDLPFPYSVLGAADLTDDRGVYRIYGLVDGTYVVAAGGSADARSTSAEPYDNDVPTYAPASTRDTAREIMVRTGAETTNVDIQYRGDAGHAVSGTVIGPRGERPANVSVTLVSASGPLWEKRAFQESNEQGFVLNAVDDGSYHIVAIAFGGGPSGEFMLSTPKEIKVRGADVTGVEIVVQPLSSVTGRIILEETKSPECNDKQRPVLTETVVFAQSSREIIAIPGSLKLFGPLTSTDHQGNISLKHLASGRYYFTTQHFGKDWYLKSIQQTMAGKPFDVARSWTTLKPGEQLNGLTITLAQGAASLRGQLAFREGETPPGKLNVYLVPAEKDAAEDPLRFYAAAVAEDGKVALDQVAPGRYLVLARVPTDEPPLTKLRSPDATTHRTKLRREAETLKSEIELKPCQTVSDFKIRF